MSVPTPADLVIRALEASDHPWLAEVAGPVGGSSIVSRGTMHQLPELPGFVATRAGTPCGFASDRIDGPEAELVAIEALEPRRGVGSALLSSVERAAREAGSKRLWLVTTNDNLDALRFYQRRGFRLAALHREALAATRRLKPSLPEVGEYGIPLRDELELEKQL